MEAAFNFNMQYYWFIDTKQVGIATTMQTYMPEVPSSNILRVTRYFAEGFVTLCLLFRQMSKYEGEICFLPSPYLFNITFSSHLMTSGAGIVLSLQQALRGSVYSRGKRFFVSKNFMGLSELRILCLPRVRSPEGRLPSNVEFKNKGSQNTNSSARLFMARVDFTSTSIFLVVLSKQRL